MRAGHGHQGGHGGRAAGGAALRPRLRCRLVRRGPAAQRLAVHRSCPDLAAPRHAGAAHGYPMVHRPWRQQGEHRRDRVRADPAGRDHPLSPARVLAASAGVRLQVAGRDNRGGDRPVGHRARGAARGHAGFVPALAMVGIPRRRVLPHPRPDLQHRAVGRRRVRAPDVPAARRRGGGIRHWGTRAAGVHRPACGNVGRRAQSTGGRAWPSP